MLVKVAQRQFSQGTGVYKRGLYAGSFDPPSQGHVDIIQRGITLVDELHIGIGINNAKKYQ